MREPRPYPSTQDLDTARVIEVLRGARRAEQDPDVALAELLATFDEQDDTWLASVLERLARDADKDRH